MSSPTDEKTVTKELLSRLCIGDSNTTILIKNGSFADFVNTTTKKSTEKEPRKSLRKIANSKNKSCDESSIKNKLDNIFKTVLEETDILFEEAEKGKYFYEKEILSTSYDTHYLTDYEKNIIMYYTTWNNECKESRVNAFVKSRENYFGHLKLYMIFMW